MSNKEENNNQENDIISLRDTKEWKTRMIGILLFLGVAFISGYITWLAKNQIISKASNSVTHQFHVATSRVGFTLNEILIQGRSKTPPEQLLKAINAKRGTPILALNVSDIKDRLEKLTWVKSAKVKRQLPNILHIVINERQPIAIWQNNKKFFPIDNKGIVIKSKIDGLTHLPIVVGENAPEKTSELLAVLKSEPAIATRVKAATYVSSRRWNIVLDDIQKGVSVRLPEDNLDKAWARLANLDKTQGILKRKVSVIDLRLPDRLTVKVSNKASKTNLAKTLSKKQTKI